MSKALATASARDVRIIGLISLAHSCSHFYQLVLPPLFPFIIQDFGASYTEIGLLVTLFYAASGLAQTPAGFQVDRFGASTVLIAGLGLLATATMLYGLAPVFWVLLPLVVLAGFGNSVFHPADYSILTTRISERRMGRAYSIHTFGGNLGWAAAPVTVFTLATLFDWRTALIVAGTFGLLVAALLILQRDSLHDGSGAARHDSKLPPRNSRGAQGTALAALLSYPVMLCFVYFILFSIALIGIQSFLPATLTALRGTPLATASAALAGYLLGSSVGVLFGGVLADRAARHDLLVAGGLAAGAVLMIIVGNVALTPVALIGAVAVAGFLMGGTQPSRDMLVRASATRGATGRVFGFVYSGLDAGAALAPLAIGLMLDHGAARLVFWFIAAMLVASLLSALALRRSARPVVVPGV